MSAYCPNCKREIVWGETASAQRIALDPHPEARYYFAYRDMRLVRYTDTYQPHNCPKPHDEKPVDKA